MLLLDAIVAIIAIGCLTGIASMLIDKLGVGRHRALEEELRLARDRIALLERQNTHLEQQVEWHARFLHTLEEQHRVAKPEAPMPLPGHPFVGAPDQLPAGERADEQ